jgi:hypothetical protein
MIRFVSLNIERSKHLDLVIPFLQAQNADVVCLQELMDKKMVDGVFSTPEYEVSNVQLHSGVSDHLAITGDISKAESA